MNEGLANTVPSEKFDIISLNEGQFQGAIEVLQQRQIGFRRGEIDLENRSDGAVEEIDDASIFYH